MPIKGSHKLKPRVPLIINPLVLSLGNTFDVVADLAIITKKKGKKCEKKSREANQCK